jgi:membrane-associated protease RseP (regulator of RpoE activity)
MSVLLTIDVFVALANLFPMLPLDGGHVLVAVYERARSRRGRRYVADVAKLTPVAWAFVVFLLVFVGSALFLDITHPVANPFG